MHISKTNGQRNPPPSNFGLGLGTKMGWRESTIKIEENEMQLDAPIHENEISSEDRLNEEKV
jgi:hypothetical protein